MQMTGWVSAQIFSRHLLAGRVRSVARRVLGFGALGFIGSKALGLEFGVLGPWRFRDLGFRVSGV